MKFASTLYIVPEIIKRGQEGIELEWFIEEGNGLEIEEVLPGCGCTAEAKVHHDRVTAVYNDNTKEEELAPMPGKMKTVSKNLRVFIKDGKPLKIKNARGVEVYNPEKTAQTLFFHVNVQM